ncbi:MAG: type II toxin-antitoxin system RelE/ParE family toxin [Gammaproteobacteria bacterium]|nr:type II toxin-antitoxin system RelE/ParE family toxin [Gammaproteobacteria bacterium]
MITLLTKYEIRYYITQTGKTPFITWLKNLKNSLVKHRLQERLDRVAMGNFGDHKSLSGGIYELRCNFENGIRMYYGIDKQNVILLLCGGNKSSQQRDIQQAITYWQDYCGEKNEQKR